MFESHTLFWPHKHRTWILLLLAVLLAVSLAYYLLMAAATSYPVIPFPKEVREPTITIGDDGARIALDTLPRWEDYLRLLEQQGWRQCTFEVCGFIHVTDTSFQVTYYYGQDRSPPILQVYSGVWFSGGAYMNLYNCGRVSKTTQLIDPSWLGCTLRLPTASPSH
jgi:hypothetical protein